MKSSLSIITITALLATSAMAGDAMNKCVADTSALGANDPEAGCTCFVKSIPEDAVKAYAKITDWESEATAEMKKAAAVCFPELQPD